MNQQEYAREIAKNIDPKVPAYLMGFWQTHVMSYQLAWGYEVGPVESFRLTTPDIYIYVMCLNEGDSYNRPVNHAIGVCDCEKTCKDVNC